MNDTKLDLDWLLKLRLVVARCGEMDCARWWSTDGQLGPRGASVLQRGFPRTHHFAQARSVFAVAAARCAEAVAVPGAVTLWWLGEDIEDAFDQRWEEWLDHASEWADLFDTVAQSTSKDVAQALQALDLISPAPMASLADLRLDPGDRAVRVAPASEIGSDQIALLAIGFSRGGEGKLVVPYAVPAQ